MNPQRRITRSTIGRATALLGAALLVALGLAAIAIAGPSKGQSAKPTTRAEVAQALVGTWRLTAFPITDQDGNVTHSYSPQPAGKLTYTPQGDVWALVADKTNPGKLWYTGTLEVRARAQEVVHHVQYSSVPQFEGQKLVRHYDLRGNRLVLSFPVSDTETAHGTFVRVR